MEKVARHDFISSSTGKPQSAISFHVWAARKRKTATTKIARHESLIGQTPGRRGICSIAEIIGNRRQVMRSKSDHAWRMAAQCAKLAQEADQKDERDFYVRMRDSWITVANRFAFLDVVDEHGLPGERSAPAAGRYIPYPVGRSLERRRSPAPRR
jgi:hypothetical protein